MRAPVSVLGLLLFAAALSAGTARSAELTPADVWLSDFAEAEAQAKRLNRPLVVHFYAPWCGPCKKMESQVLNSPQLLKTLYDGFIAVKVNTETDKGAKAVSRFKIQGLPTDMVLSPEGKVLVRTQGYDSSSKPGYLASISRIDTSYKTSGQRLPRGDETPDARQPAGEPPAASIRRDTIASAVPVRTETGPDRLVPDPVEPQIIPEDAQTGGERAVPAPPAEPAKLPVALDGYCPVTLRLTRTWKEGDEKFTAIHQGLTYHLLGQNELTSFREQPEKFVPRLLGCDPVALTENDLAIPGSTKFGAFYDGNLFLFENADARSKFKRTRRNTFACGTS
jgi:thiol-disulfide isomerase/thioredoxin